MEGKRTTCGGKQEERGREQWTENRRQTYASNTNQLSWGDTNRPQYSTPLKISSCRCDFPDAGKHPWTTTGTLAIPHLSLLSSYGLWLQQLRGVMLVYRNGQVCLCVCDKLPAWPFRRWLELLVESHSITIQVCQGLFSTALEMVRLLLW